MFRFVCDVVRFCRKMSAKSGVDRHILWQLAEAATSAGANLEEAKAAYSRRDFAAKTAISLKEMHETGYWLRVIDACELGPPDGIRPLLDEADQLTSMLTAGMKRLHPMGLSGISCVKRLP
jgi:four helix bundle protein